MNTKYNLEERLIDFSVSIIAFVESLPNTRASNYIGNQLLRSGIAPALNYGEAQAAESRNDFIHKMKICLKELRESHNSLKILYRSRNYKSEDVTTRLIKECDELASIFYKSIATAQSRK
jgi:four helix bundle protein